VLDTTEINWRFHAENRTNLRVIFGEFAVGLALRCFMPTSTAFAIEEILASLPPFDSALSFIRSRDQGNAGHDEGHRATHALA
jgi:hypothetical protein